jgi:DNA-binding MarR family transcriptional regulator
MKFSDSKLSERMRVRPSVERPLPDLLQFPREYLNLMAIGISHRYGHAFTRWLDRDIDTDGELNGPRLMLILLLSRHKSLTMSEAADLMDVTPRAVTRLVDGLEADGYVSRQTSPVDKRVFIVTIDAKGIAKAEALLPQHQARAGEMFSIFSDEEMRTFIELNHRLAFKLKQEEGQHRA